LDCCARATRGRPTEHPDEFASLHCQSASDARNQSVRIFSVQVQGSDVR
jgi:hypothetical protein